MPPPPLPSSLPSGLDKILDCWGGFPTGWSSLLVCSILKVKVAESPGFKLATLPLLLRVNWASNNKELKESGSGKLSNVIEPVPVRGVPKSTVTLAAGSGVLYV